MLKMTRLKPSRSPDPWEDQKIRSPIEALYSPYIILKYFPPMVLGDLIFRSFWEFGRVPSLTRTLNNVAMNQKSSRPSQPRLWSRAQVRFRVLSLGFRTG